MYDPADEPNKWEPLPNGKYLAMIVESAMKPTKERDGEYLELRFKVLEGEYKDRVLFARLNLKNKNPQAVMIARGELAAIREATGVRNPKDSIDLHNLPIIIRVACRKRDDTGELTNEIKGYEPKSSAVPTQAPITQSRAPWRRDEAA
jgi:hypothetical protein